MSNQPTHHVYFVKDQEGEDKKSIWTKIGAAWSHGDGKGFSVELEFIPVSHGDTLKLTLREPQERPDAGQDESESA